MGALGGLVFALFLIPTIKLAERRWPERGRGFHVWTSTLVAAPVSIVVYLVALSLVG